MNSSWSIEATMRVYGPHRPKSQSWFVSSVATKGRVTRSVLAAIFSDLTLALFCFSLIGCLRRSVLLPGVEA